MLRCDGDFVRFVIDSFFFLIAFQTLRQTYLVGSNDSVGLLPHYWEKWNVKGTVLKANCGLS